MAGRIRLIGKKRGDRRTGSERLGSYGEAMFFAVLAAVGSLLTYLLLSHWIWPQWKANLRFDPTECVVLYKRIVRQPSEDASGDDEENYYPEVRIRYEVEGRTYKTWTYDINYKEQLRTRAQTEAILDALTVGASYRCWYDPEDPQTAVLVLGYTWWMWTLLIAPVGFIAVGAYGMVAALVQSGASTERRAAMARRAADIDLFDEKKEAGPKYPNVPRLWHLTDSPGTRLAYRLPIEARSGWTLAGVAAVALLWNAIVIGFAIKAVRDFAAGAADWWITALVLVPFIAAGGWLIWYVAKIAYRAAGTGATRLEISGHPLTPGETYDVLISQAGQLTIDALEIALICEEQATYRQGTNVRIEQTCVRRETVFRRENVRIEAGMPFEESFPLTVPADAMHSFESQHNEIRWSLEVTGDAAAWSNYQRRFPIIIRPGVEDNGSAETAASADA